MTKALNGRVVDWGTVCVTFQSQPLFSFAYS